MTLAISVDPQRAHDGRLRERDRRAGRAAAPDELRLVGRPGEQVSSERDLLLGGHGAECKRRVQVRGAPPPGRPLLAPSRKTERKRSVRPSSSEARPSKRISPFSMK